MKNKVLFVSAMLFSLIGHAQEENSPTQLDSVFIDSKTLLPERNSGKVVTVISSEEIAQQSGASIADIVNNVAGIEINGSRSNDGQNLSYLVRGGRNRQVVIMVDGVQLNDPSQIANDFDLRLLAANTVESIEILKGASSVLYGSGAATAVINIKTKKVTDKKISATFSSTLGTNRASGDADNDIESFTNYVGVDGTLGKLFYDADFSHRYTNGLSAISAPEGAENFEADVFNRYNVRFKIGYRLSEKIQFSQFVSFDDFRSEFDDFSYLDAENLSNSKLFRTGGNFSWKYKNGTYVFNDSYAITEREIESSFPAMYKSKAYTFDTYADHRLSNQLRVVLGLNGNFSSFDSFTIPFGENDFQQQVFADDARFSIIDPYVNAVYISDFGLNLNAGMRVNIHSVYDTNFVYNLNPSYTFEIGQFNLKLLASYSTAYITPSLFQLYDPLYGNVELLPEENTTIEGGIVADFGEKISLSAVYFTRDETNFIDFVTVDPDNFIFQYRNIEDKFNASGFEITSEVKLTDKFEVSANYTNTQADERFLLRIPEHKANGRFLYRIGQKSSISASYQFVGERSDAFFNPETFLNEEIVLGSYGTLGLNANIQLNDTIKVFASVFNLLDEEFEELFRYQTRGRNVRAGFVLNF